MGDAELELETGLREIAATLESEGVETSELRELENQVALLERPPGLLDRVTKKMRTMAARQWQLLLAELGESREALRLIQLRLRGERELTPEEVETIRDQLTDLVKLFPAGVIAAAHALVPVPGPLLLTPWVLARLGLMPSRWREAYILERLRRQQELLQRTGHEKEAEKLDTLRRQLETAAQKRDTVRREARLLTHWDQNQNGKWDEDERANYRQEVERVREFAERFAARRRWFFEQEGEIFGPIRLSELPIETASAYLVCFDGKTGWVSLSEVLETS